MKEGSNTRKCMEMSNVSAAKGWNGEHTEGGRQPAG